MLSTRHPISTTSAVEVSSDIMQQLKLLHHVRKDFQEFHAFFCNFALAALVEGHRFASALKTSHSSLTQDTLHEIIVSFRLSLQMRQADETNNDCFAVSKSKAIRLLDIPNFDNFYSSVKEHHSRLEKSLQVYQSNPNKLSLARHCAITIENSIGIFMQLSALLRNEDPLPPTFFADSLFNAEFDEGYTWVVKAAPTYYKSIIHRMRTIGTFNAPFNNFALMNRMAEGVVYLTLNPWDGSVLGFFILNVDIQKTNATSSGIALAYYIEVDPSFEGCGMNKRIVKWIWTTACAGGYNMLSFLPLGNDLQSFSTFWEDLGFIQSCTTQEWYKEIRP